MTYCQLIPPHNRGGWVHATRVRNICFTHSNTNAFSVRKRSLDEVKKKNKKKKSDVNPVVFRITPRDLHDDVY